MLHFKTGICCCIATTYVAAFTSRVGCTHVAEDNAASPYTHLLVTVGSCSAYGVSLEAPGLMCGDNSEVLCGVVSEVVCTLIAEAICTAAVLETHWKSIQGRQAVCCREAVYCTQLVVSRLGVPFVRCCSNLWLPAYASGDKYPFVMHAVSFTHSLNFRIMNLSDYA